MFQDQLVFSGLGIPLDRVSSQARLTPLQRGFCLDACALWLVRSRPAETSDSLMHGSSRSYFHSRGLNSDNERYDK